MIKPDLKVFMLEDQKTDEELVKRQIRKLAPHAVFTVARDRASFYEKIKWGQHDVILADYDLPDFTGMEALQYAKENLAYIPFIFVTGTLDDEEKVAQAILSGAAGYVLKDRMSNLAERLEKVLKRYHEVSQLAKAQQEELREYRFAFIKMKELLKKAPDFPGKEDLNQLIEKLKNYEA